MLFHECSNTVYDWLKKQPHVKEESLTDWLLYNVSEKCAHVYYQAFTRHEESENGCDWEWWILTQNYYGKTDYNAYRFLVQAKKLLTENRDNYPLLAYSNKNGIQVEMLKKSAEIKNALPLYMYYSAASADVNEQIRNFPWIDEEMIRWCEGCTNGCYLTLASKIYNLLYSTPRHKLVEYDLLSQALKLSLLDRLFNESNIENVMEQFNIQLVKMDAEENVEERYRQNGVFGIKHYGQGIPSYLKLFVENKGKNVEWLQSEMRIEDIGGLGVLDFRKGSRLD